MVISVLGEILGSMKTFRNFSSRGVLDIARSFFVFLLWRNDEPKGAINA